MVKGNAEANKQKFLKKLASRVLEFIFTQQIASTIPYYIGLTAKIKRKEKKHED